MRPPNARFARFKAGQTRPCAHSLPLLWRTPLKRRRRSRAVTWWGSFSLRAWMMMGPSSGTGSTRYKVGSVLVRCRGRGFPIDHIFWPKKSGGGAQPGSTCVWLCRAGVWSGGAPNALTSTSTSPLSQHITEGRLCLGLRRRRRSDGLRRI